jgi:DNA-binding LacI/PurR family transcriptional regulator
MVVSEEGDAPNRPLAARRPARRSITLVDVAREAGVTRWIAGTILNGGDGNSGCSPETGERIQAAAARLGYRVNPVAQQLTGKRSRTFGLLVASASDPLVAFLVQELQVELARIGCQALTGNTFEGWDRVDRGFAARIDELLLRGADGVFCLVHRWWPGDRRMLIDRFPATVFHEDPAIEGARFVATDRRACGRIAVEHLVATGRRRIGLALMTLSRPNHRERLVGHNEALAAAGLAGAAPSVFDASRFGDAFPVHDPDTQRWDYPVEIVDHCIDALVRDAGADAIVAHDDFFAAVLIKRLRTLGIRVPDDVAVVGYLNHYLADWVDPALTTIDLDHAAVAKAMVEMAERMVESGEEAGPGQQAVWIQPRLIVRESA